VRHARGQDAPEIATIQLRAWFENHRAALGTQVSFLDPEPIAARWAAAITKAPSTRHHVLVAVEDGAVVGFAAVAPVETNAAGSASTSPPAAEVFALEVDPRHTRGGHGSRLLAACVDLSRDAGLTSVVTWVLEDDGARAGFLTGAGFTPAGPSRQLDARGRLVREDAWSALL
jgi:GNAT superfamily N-acetyltransferase